MRLLYGLHFLQGSYPLFDKLLACSVEIELIALLHLFYAAAIRIVEFPGVLVGDIVCASSTAPASSTITTGAATH